MAEQDSPPPTITTMKIPIIKKGEYDIWSMRMRQYIFYTYHNLWDIIVDGDLQEEVALAGEQSSPPAPKTAKQLTAKRNKERVKSVLLLAIPDEYLLKFHNVLDAKSFWAAIKSRFRGNDESKKIQLEVHAAPVSKEDINQNFLRSLPPSWSQIALIMRNKPDIDQTDIDDLYNNLRVYEDEMKRSSSSTSNSQNLDFLSSENTSSTNEVSTTSGNFGINIVGGTNSLSQVSSTPGADEVIDQDDLEELDIRWQVAVLTVRVQRFIKKTGRNLDFKGKQHVTFDKSQVECYNCHRKWHFAKECKSGLNKGKRSYGDNGRRNATTNEPSSQALVAQDGLGGYDWSNDFDEPVNYALMAIFSSSSSSSYDNEGEKYEFQNYELKCREIKINNLKMELEKVVKERDELKVKIEKWEESSKGLNKLLNSQMSDKDKIGLGYDTQLDGMSNKSETNSEISMSVFEVRSSNEEITPANDRFSKADGYHAIPPPITGNFLTPRADISFAGKTNNVEKSKPKINRDKVIIEDWNSDDEDDVSEVNTVNPVKTNETQISTDHLIKDCDFYANQSPEPKLKTIVSTGVLTRTGLVNPVRLNGKGAVHTVSTARPISIARLISTARPVSTARPFSPKIVQTDSAIRPIYPRMDNVRLKASYSPIKRSYYTRPAVRPKDLKQDVNTSRVKNMTTARTKAVVNTGKGKMYNALKKSRWVWRPNGNYIDHESKEKGSFILKKFEYGNLEICLQDYAVVDSGCSSHMTGNKVYLSDYEDYNRGFMAFGSNPQGGKITGKGKIRTANLDFDDVYFVDELNFKLLDENQAVLRAPRQNGVYSLDLKNSVPSGVIMGQEFKNHAMNEFYSKKGIKRGFSVARTPQQNGVAERKNRTLIEAARTMLADSLLPISFWAEAVNTACYLLNKVLVTKPQNKTPYELLIGKPSSISFIRPFGCPLTILNTLDPLSKFDGKSDEGYLLGYSTTSKAFRVYNKRTKRVEENMHIDFLEDQPNVAGSGPDWMFDLDFLTNIMNYIPVSVENQVNVDAAAQEKPSENFPKDNDVQDSEDVVEKEEQHMLTEADQALKDDLEMMIAQEIAAKAIDDATRQAFKEEKKRATQATSINKLNTGQIPIDASTLSNAYLPIDPNMPDLEDDSNIFPNDGIFSGAYDDEDVGAEADFNNMDSTIDVSPIPKLRVHRDHHKGFVDPAHLNKVYKVIKALYGLHQASRAWFETLSSFLLENGFRRGTIDKTLFIKKNKSDIMLVQVYVDDIIFGSTTQSMCTEFKDCMHKRFQMSSMGELTFFLGLQVKQQPDGIFISQDKYVANILKKFDFFSIKTATTPIVTNKPLVKDEDGVDVDVHIYRSMIGSLMYMIASRPDIMFAVCACARFQVTPKASHLNEVKMIFRYLKHQPKLGLWYPRDSPFKLEAFSDSDYGGASLDRKSTTASNCCGQVLWIQNQMMDYSFNFMNTKIHIDNESTICIVKNPVYHSRTKHIEIRHHFIRDCYEKRLIDVIKIHTNANVADLIPKGFDVTRFNFLVVSIGMINL
ncbi:putative ribonuclease H-like domain-containing protein [Tanacetum coccineum]